MYIYLRLILLASFILVSNSQSSDAQENFQVSNSRSDRTERNSKFKKFSYNKTAFLKKQSKRSKKTVIKNTKKERAASVDNSNLRPSRNYKGGGSVGANVCGGDGIFNSYAEYLDCSDLAIAECPKDDSDEQAFCIYNRCGNTPDNFDSLWRDLDDRSKGGGNSYFKNNFGSSASGNDRLSIALHPCLYDGAARFFTTSNASADVMGAVYSLGNADLKLFHPAKSNNDNLSSGRVRLGFDGDNIVTINRDDFGKTTVPFSYQREIFKSFPKSPEDASRVYWVDGVIPVNMIFRPQGVIGVEMEARVSPESRVLEVQFAAYNDFGTSADAGAARDGVGNNTSVGILSLIQSEYRTNKFISMNAEPEGMLPSLSELSQLEYWPTKGSFKPICAQWFKSATTHPEYGLRCSNLVDFGLISDRKGTIVTVDDGSDRILIYDDPEDEQEPDGLIPYPYRNPILDDF